jgi:hypothetical protein
MEMLKRAIAALKTVLRRLSPNCREASRLQSEALDRPLPFWRRFGLRVHLLLCQWCRRYGRQLRFLRQTAHEHPEELTNATSERLSPEARERLKQSVRGGPK